MSNFPLLVAKIAGAIILAAVVFSSWRSAAIGIYVLAGIVTTLHGYDEMISQWECNKSRIDLQNQLFVAEARADGTSVAGGAGMGTRPSFNWKEWAGLFVLMGLLWWLYPWTRHSRFIC